MEEGDKLSALQGAKGVVSRVVPDDQMIRDKDGNVIDILINPAALIGRVNPGMAFEALLGKIAHRTGKRYVLPGFSEDDYADFVEHELKANNIPDTEDLLDPVTGKTVPSVMTGRQLFLKLEHVSDDKMQGRGDGNVDQNDQPSKGGDNGCFVASQKIRTAMGVMEIGAICEKKMAVQVLTWSSTLSEWVFRPVTDWFVRRAAVEDILAIDLEEGARDWGLDASFRRKACQTIYPTKNHWVYLADGRKVQAGTLRPGDEMVSMGALPTADQEAFLYGTLLGDSSVSTDAFLCKHSLKQQAYLGWKQSCLASLGAVKGSTRSKHHPSSALVKKGHKSSKDPLDAGLVWFQDDHLCSRLRAECYSGDQETKKITPQWLSRLTGLSIALLVVDDGCITNVAKKAGNVKAKGNIALCAFSRAELMLIKEWLEARYQETFWLSGEDVKNPYISLSVGACQALIREVARWIPAEVIPGSKKFLKNRVAAIQQHTPPQVIQKTSRLTQIPLRVKAVRPYRHDKPGITEINVYDMTVQETHSYVAGPVLVSNSKRVGGLQMLALVSHGVPDVIKDAHLYRGSSNADMWRKVRLGEPIPQPKSPFIYDKFLGSLKAAGINLKDDGKGRIRMLAMTDKDVDELAPHELQNAETINPRDGSPVKGGLMDFSLHGGPEGKGWSYIKLDEPIPNPIMEEPIRRLLGLTEGQMRGVLAGTETLAGRRGPKAIQAALESLDLDALKQVDKPAIVRAKRNRRDEAVRRLSFVPAYVSRDFRLPT